MAIQGFFPATKPVASPVGLLNSDGVQVVHHSSENVGWTNGPQDVDLLSGAFDLYVTDYCTGSMDRLVQTATDVCKDTTYPFGIIAAYALEGVIGLSLDERKKRVTEAAETPNDSQIASKSLGPRVSMKFFSGLRTPAM